MVRAGVGVQNNNLNIMIMPSVRVNADADVVNWSIPKVHCHEAMSDQYNKCSDKNEMYSSII